MPEKFSNLNFRSKKESLGKKSAEGLRAGGGMSVLRGLAEIEDLVYEMIFISSVIQLGLKTGLPHPNAVTEKTFYRLKSTNCWKFWG